MTPSLASVSEAVSVNHIQREPYGDPPLLLKGVAVLDGHPETAKVLRAVKRRAKTAGMAWEALAVETPHRRDSDGVNDNGFLTENIAMAEQMGARVTVVYQRDLTEGVISWLEESAERGEKVAFVKIGLPRRARWWPYSSAESAAWTLKKRLTEHGVTLTVVPYGEDYAARGAGALESLLRIRARELAAGAMVASAASMLAMGVEQLIPHVSHHAWSGGKTHIFLIACAFAAVRYGLAAGALAAVVCLVIMNALCDGGSSHAHAKEEFVEIVLFVLGTFAVTLLGNHELGRKRLLAKQARRFHTLLGLHRSMLKRKDRAGAAAALRTELSKWLETDVEFFFPAASDRSRLDDSKAAGLQDCDLAALHTCWEENRTAGACSARHGGCAWRFEPMQTAGAEIGVMGVRLNKTVEADVEYGKLLSGVADQAALILERHDLEERAEETRMHAERERLRSMLLSSVSHDLKTPLASVIGSLSVYRSMKATLPPEQLDDLIENALEEARRLDSFITNILDMTRLESGVVEMKREWIRFDELAAEVRARLKDRLKGRTVRILPGPAVEVLADSLMSGQVIQNLLDNAAKYTPPGASVEMYWEADERGFRFTVRDKGDGVPEDERERIFDKYSRLKRCDAQTAGTGLGLAIARTVMRAQDGDVNVMPAEGGGAAFVCYLPHWRPAKSDAYQE